MTLKELETEVRILKIIINQQGQTIQQLASSFNQLTEVTHKKVEEELTYFANKMTDILEEIGKLLKNNKINNISEIPIQEYPR